MLAAPSLVATLDDSTLSAKSDALYRRFLDSAYFAQQLQQQPLDDTKPGAPTTGGRSPHSFSIEFSPKFSPILVKILVIWIFYWIFAKLFTNFGDIFGELKKLVSFWVTKMSPILVTIIPSNFGVFCHQFWWKFRWFDEIGEFLSDKNITNSGDNNSFRFWVLFVTNFSENSSDLKKLVSFWVKKILVTIIPFNFVFFFVTKIGENSRKSPKLVTIL